MIRFSQSHPLARVSAAGVCFLYFIAPLLSRTSGWKAESLWLLGLSLLLWALLLPGIPKPSRTDRLTWAFVLCFLAWHTAAAVASPELPKGIRNVLLFTAFLILPFIAAGSSGRLNFPLALVAVFSGAWVSTLGIAEYYGLWVPESPFPGRIVSTFSNPNDLGIFLCAVLPLGITLLLSKLGTPHKICTEGATILIYTCFLMSGSRGAWWAGIFTGGFVLIGAWRFGLFKVFSENRVWILTTLPILTAITIIYSVPNPFRVPSAISIPERFLSSREIVRPEVVGGTSVGHRYLIWSSARSMMTENPILGVGPGFFSDAYPEFRDLMLRKTERFDRLDTDMKTENVKHAHNDYLQMGAEIGLPGLLLFLSLLAHLFLKAWHRVHGIEEREDRLLRLGFLSTISAILIYVTVSYPLHIPAVAVLFWTFLGLAIRTKPKT